MKNSTIFSYVLIPLALVLTFIGCVPQNPNQVYQQPIQQVVDYDNNGSYDTYYGSDGQQYAVTSIDGVQRSILLNTFLNQLNNGGYGAVYNYYNQYPTYFNTYTPGRTGWRHYGAPVTYRSYYSSHNVRPIRSYRRNSINRTQSTSNSYIRQNRSVSPSRRSISPSNNFNSTPIRTTSTPISRSSYKVSAPTKSIFSGVPRSNNSSFRSSSYSRSSSSSSRSGRH